MLFVVGSVDVGSETPTVHFCGQTSKYLVMATGAERRKAEFVKRLASAGYEDFLVLERASAERVLTDRREGVVDELRRTDPSSITELADALDRDVAAVKRDLDTLFEAGIVTYEVDGARKRPRLKHAHVFVEPLV